VRARVAALITLCPFTIYNTEPLRNGKQTGWQTQAVEGKQRHLENKDFRTLSAEPWQTPKKEKKEEDEEDAAFKAKKKAETDALKAAKDKALKGGAPGGGIKKSGKK